MFPWVMNVEELKKVSFKGVKPVPRPVVISDQRFTVQGKPCITNCMNGLPD